MLKDVTGFKISDRCFKADNILSLISDEARLSVIFGRNGTGKSTISQAIRNLGFEGQDAGQTANVTAHNSVGDEVTISEEELSRIHVFNEDFVFEKVKFSDDDGLDAIVMLGEQGTLDRQIKKLDEDLIAKEKELLEVDSELEKLNDPKNSGSPEKIEYEIKTNMRSSGKWAQRQNEILNKEGLARIMQSNFDYVIDRKPSKDNGTLQRSFNEKLDLLQRVTAEDGDYPVQIIVSDPEPVSDSDYVQLLQKVIERPKSDRDEIILEIITSEGQVPLEKALEKFSNPDTKYCPTCFKPISQEEKDSILNTIESVLNKELESHKEILSKAIQKEVSFNIDIYAGLPDDMKTALVLYVEQYNKAVKRNNELIEQKIERIHTPIVSGYQPLEELYTEVKHSFEALEEKRIEFNNAFKRRIDIEKELLGMNADIASLENTALIKRYKKQIKSREDTVLKREKISAQFEQMKKGREQLVSEMRNERVALELINESLRTIFCSQTRLVLESDLGMYRILVNGSPVKPSRVSVGERNAIALCYFFANAKQGKTELESLQAESLFVIDDPISSFDFENKVGVHVYLKSQIEEFILANQDTRVIMLTHDLSVAYDLKKMSEDLSKLQKSVFGLTCNQQKKRFEYRMLSKGSIVCKNDLEAYQPYTNMLCVVFDYARHVNQDGDNFEPANEVESIGNILRRVLEAFSTFQYKVGITEVITNEDILCELKHEQQSYFRSLMYRLILHGESHEQESVHSFEGVAFPELFTVEERRRTAQDVLCLMYSLQKTHVIRHLCYGFESGGQRKNDVLQTLDEWMSLRNL